MKTLIVNLQAIAQPLSEEPIPQHARDLKAIPGAIAALERWKNWGYQIWIFSDRQIEPIPYWNIDALMRYALYCFPLAEAVFWGSGPPENEIFRTSASGCVEPRSDRSTPLAVAIERATCTTRTVWAIGCAPQDEETATSTGINYLAGDIWLAVLDLEDLNSPELISSGSEALTTLREREN